MPPLDNSDRWEFFARLENKMQSCFEVIFRQSVMQQALTPPPRAIEKRVAAMKEQIPHLYISPGRECSNAGESASAISRQKLFRYYNGIEFNRALRISSNLVIVKNTHFPNRATWKSKIIPDICKLMFTPLTAKLFNWNFHALEVVSR